MTTSPFPDKPGSQQERRRHPRIEKHFIITFYELDKKNADHSISQLKNVSRGGFCFSSNFAFESGTRLQAMIKTPYLGQTVNVETRVVDCREKIPNMIYDVRVKIERATPQVEEILEKIEKSFLGSQGNY